MAFALGVASRRELVGVHPDLVRVVERAIEITRCDFTVHDGIRTVEEQKRHVANGFSKTMKSKHLEGRAVDLVPWIDGETITVPWQITKRVNCKGVSGRVWAGEKGFSMTEPLRPTSLPAIGKPVTHNIQTTIPELAPPGQLVLRVAGYFDCPGGDRLWWEIGPVTLQVQP